MNNMYIDILICIRPKGKMQQADNYLLKVRFYVIFLLKYGSTALKLLQAFFSSLKVTHSSV